MAIDFPTGPTNGQQYTDPNGNVWEYDGTKWRAVLSGGGTGSLSNQTAAEVPYDNATSGMAATDVQAAVDELESEKVNSDPTGVTGADQVANIVSLTQAEYDAIGAKDPATLYVITDAA